MRRVLFEIRLALRGATPVQLAMDAIGAVALMVLIWAGFTFPWVLS